MSSSLINCPPFQFSSKYYQASSDGSSCTRDSSFFGGKPVLNQGVGYSVILGFGAFFAVFTSFLVITSIFHLFCLIHGSFSGGYFLIKKKKKKKT